MRIALHLATLRGFGSSAVGRSTLGALASGSTRHEFAAWVPRDWPDEWLPASVRDEARKVPAGALSKFVAENGEIRRSLRRWRADRLFSFGDTSLPRCPVPQLLLVQQAYLAYEPAEWGMAVPLPFRAKVALMGVYFRMGLPTVSAFTVQTEDMRERLAARWNISRNSIHVVPSTIDASWDDLAQTAPSPPQDPPYICYVGGVGPHKNHAILADVMRELADQYPELKCILTVRADAVPALVARAREARVLGRFVFAGSLPRGELATLLAKAVATAIPSKLESFGLGYYEALAAGCPVVAADRGFSREALGEAGRYAPADEPEAYAAQLRPLLDSAAARAEAARACKARWLSIRKGWPEIASSYLRILEALR